MIKLTFMDESKPKEAKKSDVALREERILEQWRERRIFEKSVENAKGKEFVFYDGPPFATGQPHYGHILPGTIKDVIPRYQTMKGRKVIRRWGWDCHGLPVENLVEKELGLSSKKEILEYGIEKFNRAARESVFRYADDWKKIIPRTGRWVDMENDYRTMSPWYTESVWWAFEELYKKGLAYEGFKSMHVCPHCETTLSNFEVGLGYADITDISAYAKFELKDEPNTFLLAWTTTPWTLPGNAALAVNPALVYVKFQRSSDPDNLYISARDRLNAIPKKEGETFTAVEEISSKSLVGKSYKPVFSYFENQPFPNKENAWKIYSADFVMAEDGTGIVHIAPGFGTDDYELSLREKIPLLQHVGMDGKFLPMAEGLAGKAVKPKGDHQSGDVEIIKLLAVKDALFAKEKFTHSYPHCWRCDTPLINYATSSWFVAVQKIKKKLVKEYGEISWIPQAIGKGRFGNWLLGAKDWAVSRSRFWGAPLPVWRCKSCRKAEVVGSIASLIRRSEARNDFYLMRHGEADNNVLRIVSSEKNNTHHLTEKGKIDVQKVAVKLRSRGIDIIISSPFARTRETADIVARAVGIPAASIIFDDRLGEVMTGSFNLKSIEEYHAFFFSYAERFVRRPKGGENQTDVRRRMLAVVRDYNRIYAGKKILVITHDTPAWLLDTGLRGFSERETMRVHDGKSFYLQNAETRQLRVVDLPLNEMNELDLHRPYIDSVRFTCSCGGSMERIESVFDTWFDSGSVPFAKSHYPFENKDEFNPRRGFFRRQRGFPADFIAEGQDQTRGWFYTMLVLNTALFGQSPYKNVIVNGLVLAEDGKKMSKRLNNYPDLTHVFDKYGADAVRYYLMASPLVRAEEMSFSEKAVDDVYKKNIVRLENVASYLTMYSTDDKSLMVDSPHVLDRWICVRLEETRSAVSEGLENYEIDKAARPIEGFIEDISTWYLRRSRYRYKNEDQDKKLAAGTLRYVLIETSRIIAPFMPFLAEKVYEEMGGALQSIHLETWTLPRQLTKEEKELLEKMKEVRRIVSLGLEARAKANIKVRQPLSRISHRNTILKAENELLRLIADEINVKEVRYDGTLKEEVLLDRDISPSLKDEGDVRELVRFIQDLRKKQNLFPSDTVNLRVSVSESGKEFIFKHKDNVCRQTNASKIVFSEDTAGEEIMIGGNALKIFVEKN